MTYLVKRKHLLNINQKKVQRLMKLLGLQAKIRRKRKFITYVKSNEKVKNILNREFFPSLPGKKLVTDISYLTVGNLRMYLSVLIDLYNKEVVEYIISNHMPLNIATDLINKYIQKNTVNGTMIHSDQGTHYTAQVYQNLLKEYHIIQSMSRRGCCYDNACVENFFGHLKSELIYNIKINSKEQLQKEVEQYIIFYNNERIQLKLKGMSPVEYRTHS